MRGPTSVLPSIVLVGRGRVGRTLAKRLKEAGLAVTLLRGRSARLSRVALARADVVWLAVPDPAIAAVEAKVAAAISSTRPPVIAHASGALGPDVLAACRLKGAPVASAHPVVSFGSTATRLVGATFVLAGTPTATRVLRTIVRRLGARARVQPVHGARYHAALALAANGTAALAAIATTALIDVGFSRRDATSALSSLLGSVADNIGRVGAEAALTGPIVRGDTATVARHLDALADDRLADYVAVARLVLRVARARGLAEGSSRAIEALLDGSASDGSASDGSASDGSASDGSASDRPASAPRAQRTRR